MFTIVGKMAIGLRTYLRLLEPCFMEDVMFANLEAFVKIVMNTLSC